MMAERSILALIAATLAGFSPTSAQTVPDQSSVADTRGESAAPTGNPLWSIALPALSATREHPIFSPSRRPPAAIAPVASLEVRGPAQIREPEPLRLALVGTIIGEKEGFGVFVDDATKSVVRLRAGEAYNGWILRSLRGREVTLEKDDQVKNLSLPRPSEDIPKAARPSQ